MYDEHLADATNPTNCEGLCSVYFKDFVILRFNNESEKIVTRVIHVYHTDNWLNHTIKQI